MKERAPHSAIQGAGWKTELGMVMDTGEGSLERYRLATGYGNFH